MNYSFYVAITVITVMLLSISGKSHMQDPIPAGCEATPLELNTRIDDPKSTGFDKIDEFNLSAKLFRAQTLNIANKALKLTVTMCQVVDSTGMEASQRECFTSLDLVHIDDCSGSVREEGIEAMLTRIASSLADGAITLTLGEDLINQAAQVSKSTMDEVKGNPIKLKNARNAVKSLDETVLEVKNSIDALRSSMKYAEGSKAAVEKWDLQ